MIIESIAIITGCTLGIAAGLVLATQRKKPDDISFEDAGVKLDQEAPYKVEPPMVTDAIVSNEKEVAAPVEEVAIEEISVDEIKATKKKRTYTKKAK